MNDEGIIELLFSRNEDGLARLKDEYGQLIRSVCFGILGSKEDAEECENETYHAVWEKIPPERPEYLRAYTVGIARHIAVDRLRKNCRKKRIRSDVTDCYDDFAEFLSGDVSVEEEAETRELTEEIDRFLSASDKDTRVFFVLRYYECLSLPKIAVKTGKSMKEVRRISDGLKRDLFAYLKEKGFV